MRDDHMRLLALSVKISARQSLQQRCCCHLQLCVSATSRVDSCTEKASGFYIGARRVSHAQDSKEPSLMGHAGPFGMSKSHANKFLGQG